MERWSSGWGFVLAATGAAVGIGNIWRFPAVVGRNGGGAYLLPFLIAVFVFAVPLMILEIHSGRSGRADVVTAFGIAKPAVRPLGWVLVGVVVLILSYYLVITGWILAFLLAAITGTGLTLAGYTSTYLPLASFVGALLVVGAVLALGVRAGIERATTILMPFVFLILLGLAVFATTLEGFIDGLAFFLTPDTSVLFDPTVWAAAFGQAFFSLSAGMGILLTYGSYADDSLDVPRATVLIAAADVLVAILAGVVIFPIVFTFGLEPTLGSELAFSTLPAAFSLLPGGRAVAVAFFGLLFAAAVTSAISMMEVGVSTVRGATPMDRRGATVVVMATLFLLGLPSALSYTPLRLAAYGTPILDLLDETVGTLGLPVTALVIAIVFGHVAERRWQAASGAERVAERVVRYVLPVVLAGIIGFQLILGLGFPGWRFLPGRTEPLPALSVGALVLLLGIGFLVVRLRRSTGD